MRSSWLLAAASTFAAVPAWAADDLPPPRTSSLNWVRTEGAEACIAPKQLAESVEKVLGRSTFVSTSDAEVAVEGRVERAGPGWKAVLRVSDASGRVIGSREIEAPAETCRAMDESLAFVIAVMIDPDAERRPKPPPPKPPSRWQLHVAAGADIGVGMLPSLAVGPSLRARIGSQVWAVEIAGTYFLPQEASVTTSRGLASIDLALMQAGVAFCPRIVLDEPFAVVACAGVDGGSLRVKGSGFTVGSDSTDAIVFARASVRGEWHPTSLFFGAVELRGDVPFSREDYAYTEADGTSLSLFRMSPVTGILGVSGGIVLE